MRPAGVKRHPRQHRRLDHRRLALLALVAFAAADGRLLFRSRGRGKWVNSLAVSADGKLLAAGLGFALALPRFSEAVVEDVEPPSEPKIAAPLLDRLTKILQNTNVAYLCVPRSPPRLLRAPLARSRGR